MFEKDFEICLLLDDQIEGDLSLSAREGGIDFRKVNRYQSGTEGEVCACGVDNDLSRFLFRMYVTRKLAPRMKYEFPRGTRD